VCLGSPSPVEANPGGDGANHSLDVFPEAMAPKIHGRVIPHWYRAPVGYLKLLVINNINGFVAFRISSWRLQKRDDGGARTGVDRLLAQPFHRHIQEGLASNWQAAFLQLASLIVFSGFLYQRGAPHSRDPLKVKSRQI
jgi:hypothetical protein